MVVKEGDGASLGEAIGDGSGEQDEPGARDYEAEGA